MDGGQHCEGFHPRRFPAIRYVHVRMKGLTHHVTDEVLAVVGDTSDDSVTSHCQHSLQPHRHTSQGVVNTHYEIECSQ